MNGLVETVRASDYIGSKLDLLLLQDSTDRKAIEQVHGESIARFFPGHNLSSARTLYALLHGEPELDRLLR